MWLFGFACGRCWDYDCRCTLEELKEYEEESRISREKPVEIKVSKTFPKVSPGDIIVKDSKQYYIKKIDKGSPIGDTVTNNSLEMAFNVEILEPYQKIVGNI